MSSLSEHLAELREHWDRNDKWFDVMCVTLIRGHMDEISNQTTAITDLEALVGELGEALVALPEPHEYLNAAQLKPIRPFIDALNNWHHRHRATLAKLEKARG